jgi:hypothetical protein
MKREGMALPASRKLADNKKKKQLAVNKEKRSSFPKPAVKKVDSFIPKGGAAVAKTLAVSFRWWETF